MGGKALVQAVKEIPIDLRVGDIDVEVVGGLHHFEIDRADVALHDGAVDAVGHLLRALVAIVCVAVLNIVPHGENTDGVAARGHGGLLHAGLLDVLPLDVGLDHPQGSAGALHVAPDEVTALVIAQQGLASGDDVGGGDAVLLVSGHRRLGVAGIVVSGVAQGAGDDGHPGGLDGLHLLRQEAQGDVHELGGEQVLPLHEALVLGIGVSALAAVEGVSGGAVHEDIGGIALLIAEEAFGGETLLEGGDHKVHGILALGLHQDVEAIRAEVLNAGGKGLRIFLPPTGVLHDLVHHRRGDVQGRVFHKGGEVFLRQAHLADAHIVKFLQPPGGIMIALFRHPFQLGVVQDDVVGLVGGFHLPASGDDEEADGDRQGQNGQGKGVFLDVLLHCRSFLRAVPARGDFLPGEAKKRSNPDGLQGFLAKSGRNIRRQDMRGETVNRL